MKILLIDDREDKRQEVYAAIKSLDPNITIEYMDIMNIQNYIPNNSVSSKNTRAPEDLLAEKLEQENIDLIVVDHDLTMFESQISEPVVSIASHAASIPLCRYARVNRTSNMSKLSDAVEAGTTFSIKLDIENLNVAAENILEIIDGFYKLKTMINSLDSRELEKGPAHVLAVLFDDLAQEDYISQYSISANTLADILELYEAENNKDFDVSKIDKIKRNRLAYIIGYWLYNSILRFPGVILNKNATCSFLNIDVNSFNNYKKYFEKAKYNSFFSKNSEYWWKNKLNFILDEEDVWNGKELVEKKEQIKIEPCKCSYNTKLDAGFYCVIKKAPVSLEMSLGQVSWLPKGASLCRVGKEPYEQLSPLLGL